MPSPAGELLADLRAGARWIVLATAVGGALGGAAAVLKPATHVSSAVLLAAARTPDPEGHRRKPISLDELRSHLDAPLLDAAAQEAGLPSGALAGAVSIAARSESGLYDVSVALPSPDRAPAGADAVVKALAARLGELRRRKAAAQVGGDEPSPEPRLARGRAEAAYLAELRSGRLEQAEAALGRAGDPAALAGARAERERLRLAFEQAHAAERAADELFARARAAALAFEPAAEPFAAAGAPTLSKPSARRGLVTGAGAALLVSLAGVLLLGAPLRRDP